MLKRPSQMERTMTLTLRLLALGATLIVVGCGANMSPVLAPAHVPVVAPPPGVDGTARVHEAIVRALVSRGWQVVQDAPGVVTARVEREKYFAVVDIPYTAAEYSIIHKESAPAFKFDGQHIHKHYNTWVSRLEAAINAELIKPVPAG
ncbi:MAG TPA: hypothetical protein VH374_15960 [Polyangia bacterium]|jgi:hypothetical protein|nr:hypothetical protein [Polyangia bacterium]